MSAPHELKHTFALVISNPEASFRGESRRAHIARCMPMSATFITPDTYRRLSAAPIGSDYAS
jgi:hypothetical protein